ncbi:FmdB family zinc ribbon protein [Paraburkholderia kururiensis]|uniref:FmdB family zinc ribbon protein n=1 Tax=Paraburkholderia kururiensis TaxID=984307 RepID=A0ABZ0WGZ7_9BURK|nr:FmdB family zinc ribbon protein [Paraburkholderia kururiensis]WQD76595.1 FmdB family zinc ribbon protein [Paraburkholderia kururiensis]
MPIYAYRCESCGFQKDVLQKMSDSPLTQCPECQKDTFRKQVTAAGFQLKGSGWYVTDFRGGNGAASGASTGAKKEGAASAESASTTTDGAGSSQSAGGSEGASSAGPAATSSAASTTGSP